jgi:two-component system CheB/CheR fusion protein
MRALLDDLLDVSRITSDKFVIEAVDMDLRDAIDTAVEATAPLFEARRIALAQHVAPGALRVKGDARRVAQVVGNLLANAATYSPTLEQVLARARPLPLKSDNPRATWKTV